MLLLAGWQRSPGIGVINATALVAAIGDARSFRSRARPDGVQGPRQATTGGNPRLLGIAKRGSQYLSANLIRSARAFGPKILGQETPLGRWTYALAGRAHRIEENAGTRSASEQVFS